MSDGTSTTILRKIARVIVTFFDVVYKLSVAFARILLVAMVAIISVNVFMRYVLNSGLLWGEEVALVLVGWFVFISIPMGIRKKLHISLHLWRRKIPTLDTILERVAALGVLIVGVVLLIYGNRLVGVAMKSIMPATKLPSGFLYMVLPLSAVLMIYEGITDLVGYNTDTERAGAGEELDDDEGSATVEGPHA